MAVTDKNRSARSIRSWFLTELRRMLNDRMKRPLQIIMENP